MLSFVGFAPAEEPRLAMLVMLDEPKNEKWGSEAAAPIFSAIGGERPALPRGAAARRHAAVQIVAGPSETAAAPRVRSAPSRSPSPDSDGRVMPDLRGQTLRHALATLAPLGVDIEVDGRGLVVAQAPAPGVALPSRARLRCG